MWKKTMPNGYTGCLLRVDLSKGHVEATQLDEQAYRNYIGGSGLAAWIISRGISVQTTALSRDNLLVFTTGPFTGTAIPTSGRHSIAAKSPLTGIWGESDVGGTWGYALKRAGFDGIVISGSSSSPVYLWIHNRKAEIRDAGFLWGRDTYEVEALVREKTDEEASVSCIGPSGESLVKLSAVMHDGRHARAAGRCGLGAVMGYKKLKAIAAKGDEEPQIAARKALMGAVRQLVPDMVKNTKDLRRFGTSGSVEALEEIGDLPIKNWVQGRWQGGAERISGTAMKERIYTGDYFCKTCVIGCGKKVKITRGRFAGVDGAAAEHETVGTLGALCLIDDLEAITFANDLCNRLGMDTISVGGAIAFAMEAFEKGLIGRNETDGIDLSWGNAEAMVEMVRRIGTRTGRLGTLLGEGVRIAAEAIGGRAWEFAMHVKGLELPAHDPRAFGSLALGYATSNRGACHLQAYSHPLEGWINMPDLGYHVCADPHIDEGKGPLVAQMQNLMALFDSLKICKFSIYGGVRARHLVEFLNCVTGWDVDLSGLMSIGDRIFTLKRLFNCRCGIGRKDDTLPPRLLTSTKYENGSNEYLPHLGRMLNEYYRYRGWDEEGIPTKRKLREVGLHEL
jgi:aldehyde:ferredoxin oxidoreductase